MVCHGIPSSVVLGTSYLVHQGTTAASPLQLLADVAQSPDHQMCCLTLTCSCLLHWLETEDQNCYWSQIQEHCSKLEDWAVAVELSGLLGGGCPSGASVDWVTCTLGVDPQLLAADLPVGDVACHSLLVEVVQWELQ